MSDESDNDTEDDLELHIHVRKAKLTNKLDCWSNNLKTSSQLVSFICETEHEQIPKQKTKNSSYQH